MKPDVIIINRGEDGKLHHTYWTTEQKLTPFEDTKYIRKDALMDWLIEQRDNAASLDDQFVSNAIGEYEAYQETIDKLNEM